MSENNFPKMPELRVSKNGYEIRTEILAMAKDLVGQEYAMKYAGWEITQQRNNDGTVKTTVNMPEFPGLDKILETAEKMYSFVNQSMQSKK